MRTRLDLTSETALHYENAIGVGVGICLQPTADFGFAPILNTALTPLNRFIPDTIHDDRDTKTFKTGPLQTRESDLRRC